MFGADTLHPDTHYKPAAPARRIRDRSEEILQRAARIVAEKRQQRNEQKNRLHRGIERLSDFVRKIQEAGILRALQDYPQIRIVDLSHSFGFSYKGLEYIVNVDAATGNLSREMTFEKEPGRAKAQSFDENRAIDDLVEYIAIMIAKIQMGE